MTIPPVADTRTDIHSGETQQSSGSFSSSPNVGRVSNHTLNAWKNALNNKQGSGNQPFTQYSQSRELQEQDIQEQETHKQQTQGVVKPSVENNSQQDLIDVYGKSEPFNTESTIQQWKERYWPNKDAVVLHEKNSAKHHVGTHATASETASTTATQMSELLKNMPSSSHDLNNPDLTEKWALKENEPDVLANPLAANIAQPISTDTGTHVSAPVTVNETELQNLLEKFCNTLYLNPNAGLSNLNNIVLDVGRTLPGTMIEISQQGAFLNIKLYSSDQETLRAMKRDREKLSDGLSASTNLVVRVETIFRDQHGDSSV